MLGIVGRVVGGLQLEKDSCFVDITVHGRNSPFLAKSLSENVGIYTLGHC